jgi:hypothetical protein
MKSLIITESEKQRILNMHKSRTSKNYLMEEGCLNPTPNAEFINYVTPPDGFDTTDPSMDLPAGKYNLVQVASADPNKKLYIYYVNDLKGCFTGYVINANMSGRKAPEEVKIPTQIDYTPGEALNLDGNQVKLFELMDNKYPKASASGGQTIR